MKAFGRKLKRGLKSAGEFFYEVLSCFSPENIRETDRLLYEMSNPFTLKDYEILITKDPQELLILESLRKKAEIPGDIILGRSISLEKIIRKLIPPTPKEKIEYISALKDVASGKLECSKYTTGQVGSGFTYVKFESRKLEHEPYTDDEVNLNER